MSLFYLRFTGTFVNMDILKLLTIHLWVSRSRVNALLKIKSREKHTDYATNLCL